MTDEDIILINSSPTVIMYIVQVSMVTTCLNKQWLLRTMYI